MYEMTYLYYVLGMGAIFGIFVILRISSMNGSSICYCNTNTQLKLVQCCIPLYLLFISFLQLGIAGPLNSVATTTVTLTELITASSVMTYMPTNTETITTFGNLVCIVNQKLVHLEHVGSDYMQVILKECWNIMPETGFKGPVCHQNPLGLSISSYLTNGINTFTMCTHLPTSTISSAFPTISTISNVTTNAGQCGSTFNIVGNYMGFLGGALTNILSCELIHNKLVDNVEVVRPYVYLPVFDTICNAYAYVGTNYFSGNIASYLSCAGFSVKDSSIMISVTLAAGTIISLFIFYINPFDTLNVYMWRTVGVLAGLYTNIIVAPMPS